MTAVLGVLNKHAVAIAADSAVTRVRPNGQKISNTANKIFKLSKSYPVGVAIFNSSEYMGTPWEIVISMYRKKLRDKHFDNLSGYVRDFFDYLRTEFSPSPTEEKELMLGLISNVWQIIEQDTLKEFGDRVEKENFNNFILLLRKKIDSVTNDLSRSLKYKEYENYSYETFVQTFAEMFEEFYKRDIVGQRKLLAETYSKEDLLSEHSQLVYHALISHNEVLVCSGLVFAGFGEKDCFPSIYSVQIYPTIAGRLRFVTITDRHISKDDESAIFPYAQHDVIDTILGGVDPLLETAYVNNGMSIVHQIQRDIAHIVEKENPDLAKQILQLNTDAIKSNLQELNKSVQKRNYIDPLLVTVGSFSKGELANMAERLIDLTSLKRKMTFDEESVGGPVDVAVISKADGFIWIRRKQYFDKELNIDYLVNKIHDDTKSI